MATALKLRSDIKKLKGAIASTKTPKNFIPKLKAQLEKVENELSALKGGAKPRKVSTTKGSKSLLDRAKALVKKNPKFSGYKGSGVDLEKDSKVGALPIGRRISQGLKGNKTTSKKNAKGHVYYEYRVNRLDVKQPKAKQSYPKLEDGGYMADGGKINTRQLNKKIKDWYIKNYPTDELGEEINDKISFRGLWAFLWQGDDVYDILGVHDSIVRERVFEKLAEILDVDYDVIYQKWLKSGKYEDGGYMEKGGKINFKFKVGDIIKVPQYDGGKLKKLSAEIIETYSAKQNDGTYYPFYYVLGKWDNAEKMLYDEEKILEYGNKPTKMADGGYMAKGGKTKDEPKVIRGFSDDEAYEYAKGGMTEHGLKIGDKIISSFDNVVVVENDGKTFVLNLNVGKRWSENQWFALNHGDNSKFSKMTHGGKLGEVHSKTHRYDK